MEDLELSVDGFTCVTGPTNIGKSSIVRAVSSAIKNDPVTNEVRFGKRHCTVELHSKDWGFVWEKGSGVNRYLIDGEEKHRDKVGAGQIPAVAAMGFGAVRVGDQNIFPWHAEQFEPTFLVRDNGAAVTDFFSEVTRLRVLQDALGLANRGRSRCMEVVRVRQKDVEALSERVLRTDGLDSLQSVEADLRGQADSIAEYESRIADMERIQSEIRSLEASLEALSPVSSVRIGEAPDLSVLSAQARMLAELEACADAVRAVRPGASVSVPDPPPEVDAYLAMAPFSDIPAIRESIGACDASSATIPSESALPELSKLVQAASCLEELEAAAFAARAVHSSPPVPEAPAGVDEVIEAACLQAEIEALQAEIEAMELEARDAESRLLLVQEELSLIPSCQGCGRALPAGPHGH